MKKYYSSSEAAELLGVKATNLESLEKARAGIKFKKIRGRKYYIASSIDEFLRTNSDNPRAIEQNHTPQKRAPQQPNPQEPSAQQPITQHNATHNNVTQLSFLDTIAVPSSSCDSPESNPTGKTTTSSITPELRAMLIKEKQNLDNLYHKLQAALA